MKANGFPYSFFLSVIIVFTLSLASSKCLAEDKVCFHCGMLKSEHAHSWVIIEDENDRRTEVCSIHCAAIDLVINKDTLIKKITVADYNTKKQIDAYKAYWVIGGDLPGVMTTNAKWAFAKHDDAVAFVKEHGGRLAVFEEVIRTAFVDLYEDTMAVKRKKMMQKKEHAGDQD